MHRVLVLFLVFSLSGSPLIAQSLQTVPATRATPLQDAARAEAARLVAAQASDDYRPAGMHPAFFWTAIGLWSVGGLYIVGGAAADVDAAVTFGSILAGGGVALYVIGKSRGGASPQIVTTPRGIAVRSRIGF
jgi:hypothetical protein